MILAKFQRGFILSMEISILKKYIKVFDNVYTYKNFTEFELPTERFLNKNIPISGGGYLRILPWFLL